MGRLFFCIVLLLPLMWMVAEARIPGVYSGGGWQQAHATFYGGSDASGTMGMFSHSKDMVLKLQNVSYSVF